MGKFNGILLCTDLDGTMLRADKSVSVENKDAIAYFKKEGGTFTFITGRTPSGTRPIFKQILPNAPIGCFNGCGIYDYYKKEMLWFTPLSKSVIELLKLVDKSFPSTGIEVITPDTTYFCKKNDLVEKHRLIEQLPDLRIGFHDIPDKLAKILLIDEPKKIPLLQKALPASTNADSFDFIRSDAFYYEILPKNVSKGNLMLKIAELLNIDSSKTIAVGDNDNDVSMIKAAGFGFAVSNASPDALKVAKRITVSNEQHAIAKIINELDTGKIFAL